MKKIRPDANLLETILYRSIQAALREIAKMLDDKFGEQSGDIALDYKALALELEASIEMALHRADGFPLLKNRWPEWRRELAEGERLL